MLETDRGNYLDVIMRQRATFYGPGDCWEMRPQCLWEDKISVGDDIIFEDSFF